MSTYFLAPPAPAPAAQPDETQLVLTISLESLDGLRRIALDGSAGWTHMPGSSGLEMPPFTVARGNIPGVAGRVLQDVRAEERPVFLPLFVGTGTGTHVEHLERMDALRSIVDPLTGMFRIVGVTERTERELTVVYTGGLEGDDAADRNGLIWNKVGLTAIACDPWAHDRADRVLEFQSATVGAPFLGVVGGTDAPWPGALASSLVVGEGMGIRITSEVPVFPTLDLVGPMDSFTGTLSPVVTAEDGTSTFVGSPSWSVDIPTGVPAGSTLRLVTDPRVRSVRLGVGDPATTPGWTGVRAAGQVARGSTLRPFYPGLNVLDVSAPGGTEDTRVRLSWREAFRSLW